MGRTSDRSRYVDKHSDEYANHRKKNNDAVQKSRERSRQKSKTVVDRIKALTDENKTLEQKIKELNEELRFLQNVFQEKNRSRLSGEATESGVALDPVTQARLEGILGRDTSNDMPMEADDSDSGEEDDDISVPDADEENASGGRNSR